MHHAPAARATVDLRKKIELDLPFNAYDRCAFCGFGARDWVDDSTYETPQSREAHSA
jgi:hypothetical protein